MQLKGTVALVAGATGGIGRAIALRLAREGTNLGLIARTPAKLEELQREVELLGVRAEYASCDITDAESVDRALCSLRAKYRGRLDYLINCAGSDLVIRDFLATSPAEGKRMIELYFHGPLNLLRSALYSSDELKPKVVVDVLSHAAYKDFPGNAYYGGAKAANRLASVSIAREHEKTKFYRVYPGVVDTPMADNDGLLKKIPKNQRVKPEEIGELVLDMILGKVNQHDVEIINDNGTTRRRSIVIKTEEI